jgi:hypothetical protein
LDLMSAQLLGFRRHSEVRTSGRAGRQEAHVKHWVLVGGFVAALGAGLVYAQAPAGFKHDAAKASPSSAVQAKTGQGDAKGGQADGHTAPKQQPPQAPPASAPSGTIALGAVHIPKAVKADGKPLAAGTYQVRVTADGPPPGTGQSQGVERWAEFVQGGTVKGREVVTIVPQAEIGQVQKDTPPRPNAAKVETLKGGDYIRLWVNKGGNYYLMHLPTA